MEHTIKITTVEALLLTRAFRVDLHNEVDKQMAKIVVDRINDVVTEDLRKNEAEEMTKKEFNILKEFINTFDDKRLKKASCSCLLHLKDVLNTLLEKVNIELKKFD